MNYYDRAKELAEQTVAHRRYMHTNAEAGLDLPKTKAYVMEQLRSFGIEPKDCGYGVTATLGKGGKVLLTLHFVSSSFMLAFIRNNNDSQSVIDIFNDIQRKIGLELFRKLFPIILTDFGLEFSNPKKIEYDNNGNQRTKIFYCEPGRPDQKGSCEVNHEMIRKIFKKGESFDDYSQKDIPLMMSHINSYSRKKLNNNKPIKIFNFLYGENTSSYFEIFEIDANDITLSKNIFK